MAACWVAGRKGLSVRHVRYVPERKEATELWKLAHSFASNLVKAGPSFGFAEPPPQSVWLIAEPT